MVESLSQRIVGRVAALLLLLGGGAATVTAAVPAPDTPRPLALAAVGASAMLLGVFAWFAPWNRWPRRAALWLAPVVFGLIGTGPLIGAGNPYTYGMYFLAVFTWIGMGFPRGTALKISPLAAAAFVLPLVAMSDTLGPAFSALQVIPLCVVVGEALAWMGSRLRHAETIDAARLRAMHGLVESSERLARESEAADAAGLVARLSVEILRGDGALVLLADGSDRLAVAGSHGWPADVPALVSTEPGSSSPDLARAIASGEPIVVRRGPDAGPLARSWPGTLFVPLHGATGVIGAVVVGFRQRTGQLDEFNQNLATTFATQSALTFERLHATRALVDASLQDPLTRVANRRAADQALESVRPGDALALIDIDHFKGVNDGLGHAAGDAALRRFAAFLRRELRADDVVARYGGDEFLLVLPRGGAGAESTLERLRRTWDAGAPAATFSAGIAVHLAGRPPAETVTRADEALYRAKARGGDRVVSEAHPSDAPDHAPVPA